MYSVLFSISLVLLSALLAPQATARDLLVFAAASLSDVIDTAAHDFQQATGISVRASYASSSVLARQIEQGAPADVFISANPLWMDYLAQRDLLASDTRINLLSNELVLIAPKNSPLELSIEAGFALRQALGEGRLAMGDPDHVPAGLYAREALQALAVWHNVADLAIRADNVRVALALVARAEAPLGIVYRSDALAEPRVRVLGSFAPQTHQAIIYPAAQVTSQTNANTSHWLAFLASKQANDLFVRNGFKPLN